MQLLISDWLIPLLALTAMEIVLGIDNIVFIAILTDRLPQEEQKKARRLGLGLALGVRILLLLSLSWIMSMTEPLFHLSSSAALAEWLGEEMNEISVKDLIMLVGGLFLLWKSVHEIHQKVVGEEELQQSGRSVSFSGVLLQIAMLDVIFSLDSVITAVGMAQRLEVMIIAVILAVVVMLVFSETVSHFVAAHPTLKILALSFLILIGVTLLAEGSGATLNKGYIYFAMAFSLAVEMLNIASSRRRAASIAQSEG